MMSTVSPARKCDRCLGRPARAGAGIGRVGRAVRAQGQPVAAPGKHAEVVVVGVVLHHQHDNVADARQQVGTGRLARVGRRGIMQRRIGHAGATFAAGAEAYGRLAGSPYAANRLGSTKLWCPTIRSPQTSMTWIAHGLYLPSPSRL